MLYTLNLQSKASQLYLTKTGGESGKNNNLNLIIQS